MGIVSDFFARQGEQRAYQQYMQALGKKPAMREEPAAQVASGDQWNIMTGAQSETQVSTAFGAGVDHYVVDEPGRDTTRNELEQLIAEIERADNFVGGNRISTDAAQAVKMQLSGATGQVDPGLVARLRQEHQDAKDKESEKFQQVGMQGVTAVAGIATMIGGLNAVSESQFGYLQAPRTPAVAMEPSQSRGIA